LPWAFFVAHTGWNTCTGPRTRNGAGNWRTQRDPAQLLIWSRSMSDVIVSLLRGWVENPSPPSEHPRRAPSARDRVHMSVAVPCDLHVELGVRLAGMPEYTSASAVVRELLKAWAGGSATTQGPSITCPRRAPLP
jgi:hypothetical protein